VEITFQKVARAVANAASILVCKVARLAASPESTLASTAAKSALVSLVRVFNALSTVDVNPAVAIVELF